MKTDKVAAKTKQKKTSSAKNTNANSGKSSSAGAPEMIAGTGAIENKKARAGRGLANEGTIVSYDEER